MARESQGGHNKSHPRKHLSQVERNLCRHACYRPRRLAKRRVAGPALSTRGLGEHPPSPKCRWDFGTVGKPLTWLGWPIDLTESDLRTRADSHLAKIGVRRLLPASGLKLHAVLKPDESRDYRWRSRLLLLRPVASAHWSVLEALGIVPRRIVRLVIYREAAPQNCWSDRCPRSLKAADS